MKHFYGHVRLHGFGGFGPILSAIVIFFQRCTGGRCLIADSVNKILEKTNFKIWNLYKLNNQYLLKFDLLL